MYSLISWLDGTATGQETGWDPREFQPNQRSAVQAPMPQNAQVADKGPVSRASYDQRIDEQARVQAASGTQAGDGPSQSNRTGAIAPDAKAEQQSVATPQQLNAALPKSAAMGTLNPVPASPAPLPLARSQFGSPAMAGGDPNESQTASGLMPGGFDSLLTIAGGLGIVLGLFMVTMWCLRRSMPKAVRPLPAEVVEVLGRAPLAGRQQMHLIRFGNKLVLAAVSPSGIDAVSEITDPVEADRLSGYCEQTRSSSATATFRGILDRLDERSVRNTDEHSHRPHREYSAPAGLRNARLEDEYA